jgi:hypothetical protein
MQVSHTPSSFATAGDADAGAPSESEFITVAKAPRRQKPAGSLRSCHAKNSEPRTANCDPGPRTATPDRELRPWYDIAQDTY